MVNRLVPKARQLRREATEAEKILWKHLRARQLEGVKFPRQEPIGQYIVDFVSLEKKVVIEVGEVNMLLKKRKTERETNGLSTKDLKF